MVGMAFMFYKLVIYERKADDELQITTELEE